MSRLRQNNPLLYIFIGMPEDALGQLVEIQSSRVDTKGVGYLSIDGEYVKEDLLSGIRQVQSRFLTKIYVTSGEIKVVYVVSADAHTATSLPVIKNDVDDYLQYLYPGGMLTDIFLVLDDAVDTTAATGRVAVIDMLEGLHSENCMLYMLSNVNSRKLYESDANHRILQGIALLGIMKDYVSLRSQEHIYKWYHERYFKEDCYRNGGLFFTVGCLSVKKPVEIIKKLLLMELLTYRAPDNVAECEFVWREHTLSDGDWLRLKENVYALAMDSEIDLAGIDNYSNARAVELLFGDRLERFFELNLKPDAEADGVTHLRNFLSTCAREPSKGFHYVYAATAPDGPIVKYLSSLLVGARKTLALLNSKQSDWGNESCSPPAKRGFIARLPEYIYDLAIAYLEPKFERLQPELEIRRISDAIEYVAEYHEELARNRVILNEFLKDCKAEVSRLQETSESLFLQKGDLNKYYIELLHRFVDEDKRFDSLYSRMWRSFDNFHLYVTELESYITGTVMASELFGRDVVSDLVHLHEVGEARGIYDSIWEFIVQNQYFSILLKGGCKSLHSEINLFMNTDGQLARSSRTGAVAREKMNFFYENNDDSIDVLYHGGAFSFEDLYYEALYRGRGL